MKLTGQKTLSMFTRYNTVDQAVAREALRRLDTYFPRKGEPAAAIVLLAPHQKVTRYRDGTEVAIRGHPDVVPTNPGSGPGQASGTISNTGCRPSPAFAEAASRRQAADDASHCRWHFMDRR